MNNEARRHVHAMWAAVAAPWEEHADFVESRSGRVNSLMFDSVDLGADDRVLELACGPGGLGIAAAARAGHVVMSDVVPAMVEIAARRATAAGAENVSTAVLDLEGIAAADSEFDCVLCREGLMFAVSPIDALTEMARVVRPGGRVAVAVWGPPERNQWLSLVLDAVSAQVGHPVPPPGLPGPFALSDAASLIELFARAGFEDVRLTEVEVPLMAPAFDEWWTRTLAVAGPLAKVLAGLDDAEKAEVADRVQSSVAPFQTEAGALELPGLSLVVSACRAHGGL
jgi:ubiquinone/menaquinone biosynthesis C-methylase UbiE